MKILCYTVTSQTYSKVSTLQVVMPLLSGGFARRIILRTFWCHWKVWELMKNRGWEMLFFS